MGVSIGTLERWRATTLADGSSSGSHRWTAAARLEAVITAARMDEAARSAWCREQGLFPTELEAWKRDAIVSLGELRATSAAIDGTVAWKVSWTPTRQHFTEWQTTSTEGALCLI